MMAVTVNMPPDSIMGVIADVRNRLLAKPDGSKLADMFEQCYSNAYRTTMRRLEDGTTFIITGDIPAMWLRDSTAQVRPYLLPAAHDEQLADWIEGVIQRQLRYIGFDPYANAFNETPNGAGHQEDLTDGGPWIWERKYEVDSLCYPIQLSYLFWQSTGRTSHFNEQFIASVDRVLDVWTVEQDHEGQSPYRFERLNCPPSDTLTREGLGNPTGITGMTWSGFRPSDDACRYGYLIPANMFAVVVLRYIAEIAREALQMEQLATRAETLLGEIDEGIRAYGVAEHPSFGRMYAYEVDGLGGQLLMDDANVPSLLAIPYFGYASQDDELYINTRKFVLSASNPYFYQGQAAEGVGSPHTPQHYIWPISIAIRGLTTEDQAEKEYCVRMLSETDAGTGYMHEGFHKDNPEMFTRPWFSWANALFSELILDYCGLLPSGLAPSIGYSGERALTNIIRKKGG